MLFTVLKTKSNAIQRKTLTQQTSGVFFLSPLYTSVSTSLCLSLSSQSVIAELTHLVPSYGAYYCDMVFLFSSTHWDQFPYLSGWLEQQEILKQQNLGLQSRSTHHHRKINSNIFFSIYITRTKLVQPNPVFLKVLSGICHFSALSSITSSAISV